MKVVVLQGNLDKALNIVSRLIQANNSLPVLNNVLLVTSNGRLELQATNLELSISYKIGSKVEKKGSISIPARLFSDLIHSLKDEKIQLIQSKDNLEIHTSQLNSTINGINATEFPKVPKITTKQQISISAKKLIQAFEYVVPAVSLDESRPVLSGVYCKINKSNMTVAATDSYRLAQYQVNQVNGEDIEVIIPYRTILELIRIVKSDDIKSIDVGITSNEVVFSTEDFSLTSQLIEGSYPDYTKIVPKQSSTTIVLEKEDLQSALKVASLFSKENANTITIQSDKKDINIHSEGAQVGTNTSNIPAKTNGSVVNINLNARYLIDALNTINSSSIKIGLNDKLDPCLLSSTDDKNTNNFHIIMPLRS